MTQEEITQLASAIGQNILLAQKEILTLEEVSRYTGMKKSFLYKLTAGRKIPHYKPNGKYCFFKRSEIDEWLTSNPVSTAEELDMAVQSYCMFNKPVYARHGKDETR